MEITEQQHEQMTKLCEDIDALCSRHSPEFAFASLVDVLSEVVFDGVKKTKAEGVTLMQKALLIVVPCFVTAFKATCAGRGEPVENGYINWKNIFADIDRDPSQEN